MKLKQMIAVLSSVAMLLCGCSSANAKDQTYSDTLYDTVVKVQILDPVNENVMSGLKSLCQKYNTMFSMYVEGSDIYNINHAQGMPVDVSSDTAICFPIMGFYFWFRNCSRCRCNCLCAQSRKLQKYQCI